MRSVATVATVAVATPANDGERPDGATPEQTAELRALVTDLLAGDTDADLAEALAVAQADPEAARVSCSALLAARDDARRVAYPPGPYTTATLAERDPTDGRRTCIDCANLTAREHHCFAAWRGERPRSSARDYHPIVDLLRRCECYRPLPADPDQRLGAERWPYLIELQPDRGHHRK